MCDGASNNRPGELSGEALLACVVTDLWDSVGIPQPHQLLLDLGFKDERIKLSSLLDCMEEEIFSISSNYQNLADWSSSLILFRAVLCLYRYEIDNVKILLNQTVAERNKLKIDLSDANRRASILAQDVDENHLKLEAASKNRLKILEQKHCETIQQLTNRLDAEKDKTNRTVTELEQEITSLQNEESKLKTQFEILKSDHGKIEKDYESLQEKLLESIEINKKLSSEVKTLADSRNFLGEHKEITDISSYQAQINKLKDEIIILRDKNDELSFELEQINLKYSHKSDENLMDLSSSNSALTDSLSKNITEECGTLLNKAILCGNGIKRRGLSPTTSNYELVNEEESPRIFKVRKCNNSYAEEDNQIYKCSSINASICEIQCFQDYVLNMFDKISCDKNVSDTFLFDEKTSVSLSANVIENILQHMKDQSRFILLEIINQSKRKHFYLIFYYLLNEIKYDLSQITISDSWFEEKQLKINDSMKLHICLHEMNKLKLDCSSHKKSKENVNQCMYDNLKTSLDDIYLLNEFHSQNDDFINKLKSQILDLEKCLENEKSHKNREYEKCQELEANLESLRLVYEESEDYWASKLKEEREIFEQEQQISDDKFSDLMNKLAEYEEQFALSENKNDFQRGPLSTIDEKCMLEKQFTDLEDEFQEFKLKIESEIKEKDLEIKTLKEKNHILELNNQENIENNKLNRFQNPIKSNDKCDVQNLDTSLNIIDNNPIVSPIEYLWNQKTISSPLNNNKLNNNKVRDYQNPTFLKDHISKNNFNIFMENPNEVNENLNINFEDSLNNSDTSASNKTESIKFLPSKNYINTNFNNCFQKKILHCADLEQALQGRQKPIQGQEEYCNEIKFEANPFQSQLSPHQDESNSRAMLELQCRQLHSTLLQQQAYAETVMQQTLAPYISEIGALRNKLAATDLLVRDLYVENCHLSRNINPPLL